MLKAAKIGLVIRDEFDMYRLGRDPVWKLVAAVVAPVIRSRKALLGTVILGIGLSGLAAIFYATSTTGAWLAERATLLGQVDSAVTATEVTQHQLAQALLLATDLEAGIATTATVQRATGAARRSLIDLDTSSVAGLTDVADFYRASASELLDLIEQGDLAPARQLATGDVVAAYTSLASRLAGVRSDLLVEIERARSISGVTATVTAVTFILVVPIAMVLLYRMLANRQLRRAELEAKLAAEQELSRSKDEFIANISHELRTPLTGIYGFARLLEQGSMVHRDEEGEIIDLIITEAGELERMVDDLLAAARANAGVLSYHMEPVEVDTQLSEVVPAFERLGGPIVIDLQQVPVIADSLRLRQVLRNLIANANKHGGGQVQVIGRLVGEHYEIAVIDDGDGVPLHLLGTLFERFMHTGDTPLVAGSVGLGLHIARTLAQGMGGDLEYRRREGLTQFVLRLRPASLVGETEPPLVVAHV